MYEEIFIAGSGGQGVLSLGKILIFSAVEENKYVTYYPSYGAEMRGGTANCMVKISDSFIFSPVVENPTILTVMNIPSYLKFVKKFIPQKFLFINSSLIEEQTEIKNFLAEHSKNINIIKISATDIANKIGTTVVSNIVMLGAIIKVTRLLKAESIKNIINKFFNHNKKILELNIQALEEGLKSV